MTHDTRTDDPGKVPSPGEIAADDFRRAIAEAAAKIDDGIPLDNHALLGIARAALSLIGGAR